MNLAVLAGQAGSQNAGGSIMTMVILYAVIIDIKDEIVIVEFGSNKNCRIPMKKDNIVEIDKQTED